MFFQGLVYTILLAIATALMPSPADAQEDLYLQRIYENGEVIGCYDDESFAALVGGKPISELLGSCWPVVVQDEPVFLGWTCFGCKEEMVVRLADDFSAARKYTMETEHGQVKFVWPYPLEESDYAMFEGLFEESEPEVPVTEFEEIPDIAAPSLQMVNI